MALGINERWFLYQVQTSQFETGRTGSGSQAVIESGLPRIIYFVALDNIASTGTTPYRVADESDALSPRVTDNAFAASIISRSV